MTDSIIMPGSVVCRRWTDLDGKLVFNFSIDRDLRDNEPSRVIISSEGAKRDGVQEEIYSTGWTDINIDFDTGVYVSGRLRQDNGILIDDRNSIGIFVDLHFGTIGKTPKHFEGIMVYCPTLHQPEPPHPPDPPFPPDPPVPPIDPGFGPVKGPTSPIPVISGETEDLFPYVYMRPWPHVRTGALDYGFIQYIGTSPPSSFLTALENETAKAGRQKIAVAYINDAENGSPATSPPTNMFIQSFADVRGPVSEFPVIAERLRNENLPPEAWLAEIDMLLVELLALYDEPLGYFSSREYLQTIDNVWQSYFALVVLLDYNLALLNDLTRCLWLAHIIAKATSYDDNSLIFKDLSDQEIGQLYNAVVLLPKEVFPPHQASDVYPSGWAVPYAVGELQMVQQRLLGYAPGEIARIETIMPGERREVTNRQTERQAEYDSVSNAQEQFLETEGEDERSNLQQEAQRTLAQKIVSKDYKDFKTTYGPPTEATLNGKLTKTTSYGAAGNTGNTPSRSDDITRFARQILSVSVDRIKRKVSAVRARSSMSQTENIVSSVIDNGDNAASVQTIFRWINKVYEASVKNYGSRLMIEFLVQNPGDGYIVQQAALTGRQLTRPISPADQFHINDFEKITRANYALICAAYQVTDVEPPPEPVIFVGTTLRDSEEQRVAVPAGYETTSAKADSSSQPPDLLPPRVMVGSVALTGTGSVNLPAYGEAMSVPVSAAAPVPGLMSLPGSSPPSPEPIDTFLTNVEISCKPTVRNMNMWRMSIYRAIDIAYQKQLASYFEATQSGSSHHGAAANPQYLRDVERRELKTGCMTLMMDRVAALKMAEAGTPPEPALFASPPPGPQPSEAEVYLPRYRQFLEYALEWNEMSYSFHSGSDEMRQKGAILGADNADFASFLQADSARILVPVEPAHVLAFLYFWSTGYIWDGPDWLIATGEDEVTLVNDIRHRSTDGDETETEYRRWTMLVPTAMQTIDNATIDYIDICDEQDERAS